MELSFPHTIIKPSSETSLSILEFARIIKDILPKGVFNVITGRGSKSGQYLLDHPKISKLAFTGSTEVGREVALAAGKRLFLLLWNWEENLRIFF